MTEPTLPPASHPAASATAGLWRDRADALLAEGRLDGRAFIGGQRVAAVDGQTFACHSPIDGRKLLDVTRGQQADVDAAVRAARQAFEDGRWSRKAPAVRKRILLRFAELITQHKDELALLETLDMGKPIQYALSVDVPATARGPITIEARLRYRKFDRTMMQFVRGPGYTIDLPITTIATAAARTNQPLR